MKNTLKLYYARLANMGDLLNVLIIERLFGYRVERRSFLTGEMSAIGSHLAQYIPHGTPLMRAQQCINGIFMPTVSVWGTGFINYGEGDGHFFKRGMKFCAVRGELTRQTVERMTGKSADIPTGDAGILASALLDSVPEKRYDIGVVPHICDLDNPIAARLTESMENAVLINVKDEPMEVLRQIASCRYILSSSLHGLIAADSFGIPNMRVIFSDRPLGDGFKFDDYYSAYGIKPTPRDLRCCAAPSMREIYDAYAVDRSAVEEKKRLMRESFPFPPITQEIIHDK